jgi:hypothetical protein
MSMTELSTEKNPLGISSLPVHVLSELILGWFERTSPTLRDEVLDEIKHRGLDGGIGYRIAEEAITSASSLDNERKIWLHENFLETLWCVGYTLLAIYEKVVLPEFQGTEESALDVGRGNTKLKDAYRVLDAGLSLVESFNPSRFIGIPQPKTPNHESDQLVEKANNVFVSGGAYLLMHEVGNQFFDHPSPEAKDRPLPVKVIKADEYALHWVKRGMAENKDKDIVNAIGVMAAMTTFMFLDSTLDPEAKLERPDLRYRKALYELDIQGEPLWILASLSGVLYAGEKKIAITHLESDKIESYRDVFANIMDQLCGHFTQERAKRQVKPT